jgi:hypothetical protein
MGMVKYFVNIDAEMQRDLTQNFSSLDVFVNSMALAVVGGAIAW